MPSYYAGVSTALLDEPYLPSRLEHNPDAEYDRPDWRWLSAEFVRGERSDGVPVPGADNQWVDRKLDPIVSARILPFMAKWSELLGIEGRKMLMETFPGIFWARSVFYNEPILRYTVEALLLGGASPGEAAEAMKTSPNYIWYYEKLFFDVRDNLHNEKWIEAKVIIPAILQCPTQYQRQGIMWKLIALLFGWQAFSENITSWRRLDPRIVIKMRELIHDKNNENALIVEMVRRINRFTEGRIKEENLRQAELDVKIMQIEKSSEAPKGSLEDLVSPIIQALSDAVERPPVLELSPEEVAGDPDLALFKQLDHEAIEKSRRENKAPREEELSDGPEDDL